MLTKPEAELSPPRALFVYSPCDCKRLKLKRMRGDVINIPLRLFKEAVCTKEGMKILACAAMVSTRYVNRIVYKPTVASFMDILHVSKPTAIKYRRLILNSSLFSYNETKRTLYVKSFKSKVKMEFGRGKTRIKSAADYCIKVPVGICDLKLSDAVKMLRKLMIEHLVKWQEHKESLNKPQEVKREAPMRNASIIPLRRFAKYISMSKATAGRYMKELVCEGKVRESKVVTEVMFYTHSGGSIQKCRNKRPSDYSFEVESSKYYGKWYWCCLGREYHLNDEEEWKRFQHVIYNNKERKSTVFGNSATDCYSSQDYHDNFYNKGRKFR